MGKKSRNKAKLQWRKKQHLRSTEVAMKNSEFEQRNDDIISSFPDEILCHIISFLPFKSAVETSFLSTRWKDLWKKDLLVRHGTIDDALIEISRFLHDFLDESYKPITNNWGFQFNLGKIGFLSVAFEPNEKLLHFDFSNVKYEFPWQFDWLLDINFPTHDDIHFAWWFALNRKMNTLQSSLSTFRLKSLHLISVNYLTSEAISSMMKNIKSLEGLTIKRCNGLRSLHITASGFELKKLTILDCQQLESLHFVAGHHNIRSLQFRGKLVNLQWGDPLGGIWPEFKDYYQNFNFDDIMLDCRQGLAYRDINSCGFDSIIQQILNVKSLTLCRWVFEAVIYPRLPSIKKLLFQNLRELWWIDYAKERYNSNALISFLQLCPQLARLYISIDSKGYKGTTNSKFLVRVTRLPRLEDLKVVKLEGFPNEKEEILLAKQLKEEFDAEPLILAKSNYRNYVRIFVKENEIEGESTYKFIEKGPEGFDEICPKHVHMGL